MEKVQPFASEITDKINAMIAYWDKDLICRFANTAYLNWFGKTKEEMIDRMTLRDLLGPIYEKNLPYVLNALSGSTQEFERQITTPQGLRYALATYYPNVVKGEVLGFFVHVADVSSLKRMEQELQESNQQLLSVNNELTASWEEVMVTNTKLVQANSAIEKHEAELTKALNEMAKLLEVKGRLVSMVSHEFRSPLTIMRMSVQLVKKHRDQLTLQKLDEHLDKLERQVAHLQNLVEDVLEYGLLESNRGLRMNTLNIDQICKIAEDALSQEKSHSLKYHFEGEPGNFVTDERLVRHIIDNLISNATKYSPDASEIELAVVHHQSNVEISIKDSGMGIPKEDMINLFADYHRASNTVSIKGTGLGLSIVKRAVELLKGTVSLTSELGKGTTFKVILPAAGADDLPR